MLVDTGRYPNSISEKRVDNARAAVLYLGGVGAIAAAMTARSSKFLCVVRTEAGNRRLVLIDGTRDVAYVIDGDRVQVGDEGVRIKIAMVDDRLVCRVQRHCVGVLERQHPTPGSDRACSCDFLIGRPPGTQFGDDL
ncbi:hypothetical protein, partial [Rhodococcus koreensis]